MMSRADHICVQYDRLKRRYYYSVLYIYSKMNNVMNDRFRTGVSVKCRDDDEGDDGCLMPSQSNRRRYHQSPISVV